MANMFGGCPGPLNGVNSQPLFKGHGPRAGLGQFRPLAHGHKQQSTSAAWQGHERSGIVLMQSLEGGPFKVRSARPSRNAAVRQVAAVEDSEVSSLKDHNRVEATHEVAVHAPTEGALNSFQASAGRLYLP